jgi:hypothetical protein
MSFGGSSFLANAELEATDERFVRLLSEALARVPGDVTPVQSVRSVRFRRKGRVRGFVGLTTYSEGRPLRWRGLGSPVASATQTITFYTDMLYRLSDEAVVAVIAHELAHAWLNEHVSPQESEKREVEADELAARWGFAMELEALDSQADSL